MARSSRSASNPGYTGYPARIYYEMTAYGRGTQELKEKMVILEKWYSHLRSYLPILYTGRETEFQEKKYPHPSGCEPGPASLQDLINDVSAEINAMEENYDGTFEGITCSAQEKKFLCIMRGVFERLDAITAITQIIDKVSLSEEMEV